MSELIEMFRTALKNEEYSLNTVRQYPHEVDLFHKWFVNKYNEAFIFENITPQDIADYKRYLIENNKSQSSINTCIYAIKKFCQWGVDSGQISISPATRIEPVTMEFTTARKWLDRAEENRLMREVYKERNTRNLAIVELMRQAGIRREEVCNLRKEDISFKDRTGEVYIRKGKGQRPRTVPLNKTVIDALKNYEAEYIPHEYYFFSQKNKKKIAVSTINYIFDQYRIRTKIAHLTPHSLRHTCFKKLTDNREPASYIAYIAGHFTKKGEPNLRTQLIYTIPTIQDLQRSVDRITQE